MRIVAAWLGLYLGNLGQTVWRDMFPLFGCFENLHFDILIISIFHSGISMFSFFHIDIRFFLFFISIFGYFLFFILIFRYFEIFLSDNPIFFRVHSIST